jgi:hypothetical protein
MSYWAGFLMADGCVCNGAITLCLAERDREHVMRFASFVGYPGNLTEIPAARSVKVVFRSVEMAGDLEKLGIVPRKSKTAEAPAFLAQDRDFWRGMVDGDGSIGINKAGLSRLRLVGTRRISEQFFEFVCQFVSPRARVQPESRGVCEIGVAGSKAIPVIRALYEGARIALPRKMARAALALEAGR